MDEAPDPSSRAKLLPAFVEILLAAKDLVAARRAVDELSRMAAISGRRFSMLSPCTSTGAVLIAEGDARTAVSTLRRAWSRWQELDAPYDAARARVLIGLACRELGDEDGARMGSMLQAVFSSSWVQLPTWPGWRRSQPGSRSHQVS